MLYIVVRRDVMEWLTRMNNALDYIEENLDGDIDKKELARVACCSEFQFYRLFSFIADITLGEYVRRRRLSRAVYDLKNSGMKIIDIAYKYGYESPESFTRAFQKLHGVTPSKARCEGVILKAFPRLTFYISIKGDVPMDYRIETRADFSVYGFEGVFTTEGCSNLKKIPEFWHESYENGLYDRLIEADNYDSSEELCQIYSICDYRNTGSNYTFPYMLCRTETDSSNVDDFQIVTVPASTWAIFRSRDHAREEIAEVIQELNRRVYTQWLPSSNYEKLDGYELEKYYHDKERNVYYSESWIRVSKK